MIARAAAAALSLLCGSPAQVIFPPLDTSWFDGGPIAAFIDLHQIVAHRRRVNEGSISSSIVKRRPIQECAEDHWIKKQHTIIPHSAHISNTNTECRAVEALFPRKYYFRRESPFVPRFASLEIFKTGYVASKYGVNGNVLTLGSAVARQKEIDCRGAPRIFNGDFNMQNHGGVSEKSRPRRSDFSDSNPWSMLGLELVSSQGDLLPCGSPQRDGAQCQHKRQEGKRERSSGGYGLGIPINDAEPLEQQQTIGYVRHRFPLAAGLFGLAVAVILSTIFGFFAWVLNR